MLVSKEIQFSSCLLLPERRELYLCGHLRAIAPTAFDVLLFLIEHRDRVVRRQELIREIWKGRVVVDNVVSRTIMQAREAIGDSGAAPTLIRTVPRVGYRFVGALEQATSPAREIWLQPALTDHRGLAISARLGFLPFVNETGDANLAWVELGLLSLVVQSLTSDPQCSVLSTASVLMCTEALDRDLTTAEKAKKLMMMLGATIVVSASISRLEREFVLRYRSFGRTNEDVEGYLIGPELTQLGLRLAREVEQSIFPIRPRGPVLQSESNFVNECFSRGMQASDARLWDKAVKFFAIVCVLEPSMTNARLQYAYALARVPDRVAIEQARNLIAEAQEKGDRRLEARANYVLAVALTECQKDFDHALEAVDKAIAMDDANIGEEWRIRAYLLKAHLAFIRHDYQVCAEVTEEARRVCQAEGNRIAMLIALNNRSALQIALGQIDIAHDTIKDLIALSESMGKPELAAYGNLAFVEFSLSLFDQSLQTSETYFQLLEGFSDRPFDLVREAIAEVMFGASELRETQLMLKWKKKLLKNINCSDDPLLHAFDLYRDALIEQSRGEFDLACDLLVGACQLLKEANYYRGLTDCLPPLVLNLLRLGRTTQAAEELRILESFDQFHRDKFVRPAIDHLEAVLVWQSGDPEAAIKILEAGLDTSFPGLWDSHMRFDLAWLYLERTRLEDATQVLAPVSQWIERHPAGLAVGTMLSHRKGDLAVARERYLRHCRMVGGNDMTRFRGPECSDDFPGLGCFLPSLYGAPARQR